MINLFLSPTKSTFHVIISMLFVIPSCVFSANELHDRCSQPFNCGNQNGLRYPFWTSGREDCGHPDFKVDCSGEFAEVSITSVKYRILEANYDSGIIRLARSDFIGDLCPKDSLNATFNESVLPLAPNTKLLTIYHNCSRAFPQYVSTFVGDLPCGDGDGDDDDTISYYVTTNLSSPLLDGIRGQLDDFRSSCKSVSIPASGPWLETLQRNRTPDNLQKALAEGFQVGLNQDCSSCSASEGACGFNQNSSGFVCYSLEGANNRARKKDRTVDVGLSSGTIAGLAAGVILFLFLVLALFLQLIRKRNKKAFISQPKLKALIPLKQYSYAQVKRITKSFAEVVGRGGFGTVYRGTLPDGRKVAVKVLKDSKGYSGEDFINEVASISQTSHINIVTLLGFCYEGSKRAILYEFLENGSLDKLISSKRPSNMDCRDLYGIALGVARGLEYLHHGCRTRIVHFDIKPQNVLLDHNLCPKVSDFGLAKLCEKKESILSLLDTRGTIGYIAPELFSRMYGGVSHKSDVYSYGMLVLEMIGARNKDRNDQEVGHSTSSMYFPEWIYKDLEMRGSGSLTENEISGEEEEMVRKMTLVGLWCIQSSPSDRPPMNRVVEMMEGSVGALEVPPRPVFQIPAQPFQESSTLSENISVYTEVCSINVA
ncbi:PREDICTED: probable receptor-like protein kinase At1g67000 isoform X1 [Brassica oleracea var. oleracea]|uniref:probable receptor-like protein kinase At1g67000 isoform X1 n=1 Tax=Brassica oleracea var. oleracea TaxID=109376 RepID=UPI0006A74E55|nr:PREDICTED: probable receptor-like protein kinase At1g67000 isoform X1 [Brassica oleracea var. oleracea]